MVGCSKLSLGIACEEHLEELSRRHPIMASIPGSRFNTKKAAAKAAKKLANIHLEHDERLILLDSRSSLDAADIEVDFPDHLPLVTGGSDQHNGNAATTAQRNLGQ